MSILERMLERAVARPVVIEPMRVRHIGQILAIEREAYPRSWGATVFHDELREARAGRRHYVVARRGRTVIGYGGIMFVPDEAHITNVAVLAGERRTGIATRLLLALAESAIRRGCQAWTLEVRATSDGAQALYRKFGFAPAGVRRKYYENDTDAIVMWCHDIQSEQYQRRLRELAR
jgi:ribosomal-protein-alanine N-acetyltransferase